MKKFMVRVTESINHDYAIEAETKEDAIDAYHRLNDAQIKELDLDGSGEWMRTRGKCTKWKTTTNK